MLERAHELNGKEWIAVRLPVNEPSQRRHTLAWRMNGLRHEPCQVLDRKRLQTELAHFGSRLSHLLDHRDERMRRTDFGVSIGSECQEVLRVGMDEEVLE